MRMMLRWTVPVEKGNATLADGSMPSLLESLMQSLKPEAAYFHADGGERGGTMVFEMKEPADIARIGEQLFHGLDAAVELIPVMNADDLRKAVSSL